MADISLQSIISGNSQIRHNPSEMMSLILRAIQEASDGANEILNPTNPLMLAIEAAITSSASSVNEMKTITRRLYPHTADNWEDLYLHMQDVDYKELTPTPASATLMFLLSLDEIKRRAIPINENSDIAKITFPKHTQITVNDHTLMFKHEWNIWVNKHGSVTIKYNLDNEHVLGSARAAVINFEYIEVDGVTMVRIPIECVQVKLHHAKLNVSITSGYRHRIPISDNVYRVKAYTSINGVWSPVDTVYKYKTLNKHKASIQIIPTDGHLIIAVNPYYVNNGLIGNSLRLDIYTTKGDVEHQLIGYNDGAYQLHYYDYDVTSDRYIGVVGNLAILKVFSTDTIRGGSDAISFEQMKDRVINRSSISEGVPITELELNNKLQRLGFNIEKIKDNVTERLYTASKHLPIQEDGLVSTAIGCAVQTHRTTYEKLSNLLTVREHGERLTVLPTTLYNMDNGVLDIVDANIVETLKDNNKTSLEALVNYVNSSKLFFSPYHYVHDISDHDYKVIPYHLTNPQVIRKTTVNENPTLQLTAGIHSYQLMTRDDGNGYDLLVGLTVDSAFMELDVSDISLQLVYFDNDDDTNYYINGELVTPIDPSTGRPMEDNYIYRFEFITDWDIDVFDRLLLAGINQPLNLKTSFNIFIIVKGYIPDGFIVSKMDDEIHVRSLENYDGISTQHALLQERMDIEFGKRMNGIWHRARTTVTSADYARYDEDIPLKYTETVYRRDVNGVIEFEANSDGELVPIVLHNIGDVVLDTKTGEPIIKHARNSIVVVNGEPQLKNGERGLERQYDLFLYDGLYYFTTNDDTLDYLDKTIEVIDEWSNDIIVEMVKPELLERTDILLYPKTSSGLISVIVDDGVKTTVNAEQRLGLKFFVSKNTASNTDILNDISRVCKKTIQSIFNNKKTIAYSTITQELTIVLAELIKGVSLTGYLEDKYSTATIVDLQASFSIAKKLTVNSKLELVVEDDIQIEFIVHE